MCNLAGYVLNRWGHLITVFTSTFYFVAIQCNGFMIDQFMEQFGTKYLSLNDTQPEINNCQRIITSMWKASFCKVLITQLPNIFVFFIDFQTKRTFLNILIQIQSKKSILFRNPCNFSFTLGNLGHYPIGCNDRKIWIIHEEI